MRPPPHRADQPTHHLAPEDVLARIGSNAQRGLTDAEARARLDRVGKNELQSDPPIPRWKKLAAQFRDVLVILLIIAAGVSALLWLYERDSAAPYEAIAILAVVALNAVMGYIQESRAESAVAALRHLTAARARVIRDGQQQSVTSAEIVPGDLIVLEEGDTIPADARVLEATALQVAEATLTGESVPVAKTREPVAQDAALGDRTSMVFSGTAVTYGRGRGVVVATGMATEMGRIAGMLRDVTPEKTPLQVELDRTGRLLGKVVVVIAAVMIATILLVEDIRGASALFDVLILGVALAVAAVPEGLPAVVTAVLSIGVQRMALRKAIVRRLRAVETLGSANVIASDKTGTLTRNEMTVRLAVTASGRVAFAGTGYQPQGAVTREDGGPIDGPLRAELERVLAVADRANNASLEERGGQWLVHGDPTEGALIVAARKAGLNPDTLQARFERIAEIPFSSERKLMSTVHTDSDRSGHVRLFSKGAPDVLLAQCTHELVGTDARSLDDGRKVEIMKVNDGLASQALRTLAVAYRTLPRADVERGADQRLEHDFVFVGLVGMIDPPRDEARDAVARAKSAGIRPMMITGDHPGTARVIAADLGISGDGKVVTGADLERLPDAELDRTVEEVSVYARVNPEHKLRIVQALQRRGAVVAMTGDGVNDAPALKVADIGVAMGFAGTDVSKQAADMVLADDNFATIVAAVEEGRAIFSNIRKFLRYLLSSNIGEVMTMFLGVMFVRVIGLDAGADTNGLVLPLLATQLLWINLVTDGAPALALGVDPADANLMSLPPRARGEHVITRQMWTGIGVVGVVMALATLAVIDASLAGGMISATGRNVRYAQTMGFTTLMMCQLFNVFNARSDDRSAFDGMLANRWLWGAVGLSLALHMAVVYTPVLQAAFSTTSLSAGDWVRCTMAASCVLWIREGHKALRRMLFRQPNHKTV